MREIEGARTIGQRWGTVHFGFSWTDSSSGDGADSDALPKRPPVSNVAPTTYYVSVLASDVHIYTHTHVSICGLRSRLGHRDHRWAS